MRLTCVHIDDELLGRRIVEDYASEIPYLDLLGSGKNAMEGLQLIEEHKPDLLLSDIQMPGLLGTQLIQSMTHKPMVIFITAYEQYAIESFELDVVDYMMKPISLERFVKACNKAFEIKKSFSNTEEADHIFLNVEYSLVKIDFDTITHIEGLKDYIKIYTTNNVHPILTKSTLKAIEEKLPSHRFFRVQKSFIVHLPKIESIRNHRINIGKYDIPVSETSMPSLLNAINYKK